MVKSNSFLSQLGISYGSIPIDNNGINVPPYCKENQILVHLRDEAFLYVCR